MGLLPSSCSMLEEKLCLAGSTNCSGQDFSGPRGWVSSLSRQIHCSLAWRLGGEGQPGFAGTQPHHSHCWDRKYIPAGHKVDWGSLWHLVIFHSAGKGWAVVVVGISRGYVQSWGDTDMFEAVVVNRWTCSSVEWAWTKTADDCRDFLMCLLPPEASKCIITHFSETSHSFSGLCRWGLWRNLGMSRWETPRATGFSGQRLLREATGAVLCFPLGQLLLRSLGAAASHSTPRALALWNKGWKEYMCGGSNGGADLGAGREGTKKRRNWIWKLISFLSYSFAQCLSPGPSEIYSFPCIIGLLCYLESKQGWGRYMALFPIAGKHVSINLIEVLDRIIYVRQSFPFLFTSPPHSPTPGFHLLGLIITFSVSIWGY